MRVMARTEGTFWLELSTIKAAALPYIPEKSLARDECDQECDFLPL